MNAKKIVVLMYHRLGEAHNAWEQKYCVSPDRFAAQMRMLTNRGMKAVAIDDFIAWLDGKIQLPEGSFLLTFDDGFRGVRDYALPVLKQLGWPFTVFLVSDLIGGRDEWTRSSNPSGKTFPLLDADEIRDMQNHGVSFHSHTCNHASLPSLDDSALTHELVRSRESLAKLLTHEVSYLAYPFGHVDDRVEAAASKAGYRAAFSTRPGFNRLDENRFRVRRIDVFGSDTAAMLWRKIKFGSNDGSLTHTLGYYLDRIKSRLSGARQ
ncbi:MAG: polysaccharide deacetylase family protein [Gammaproteobacteria bacterium]|nr:polysaccharide deacetylase family protein [Gammaproteobacteria bacterium]